VGLFPKDDGKYRRVNKGGAPIKKGKLIGKIFWIALVLVMIGAMLGVTALPLGDLGRRQVSAQGGVSYIIVHAVNPEGIEIASIWPMHSSYPGCVEIYDGDTLIGYGPHDAATCNQPIAISPGNHTIKCVFNGMSKEQTIMLEPNQTQKVVFVFERTEFDIKAWLMTASQHERLEHTVGGLQPAEYIYSKYSETAWIWSRCHCLSDGTLSALAVLDVNFGDGEATVVSEVSLSATRSPYGCACGGVASNFRLNDPYRFIHSGFAQCSSFDYWYIQSMREVGGKILSPIKLDFSDGELYRIRQYPDWPYNLVRVPSDPSIATFQNADLCWWGDPPSPWTGCSIDGCYPNGYDNSVRNEDTAVYCDPSCILHCSSIPYDLLGTGIKCTEVLEVKFLDKDDMQQEVAGAAADRESQVVIEISDIPPDITIDDVDVQIVSEEDGHLENDATIEDGVFTQTYTAPEDFVRDGHSEDRTQGYREIDLSVQVGGQNIEPPPFYLFKPPVVLIHGIWSSAGTWTKLMGYLNENYGNLIYAISYPKDRHFSENKGVVDKAVEIAIKNAKNHGFSEPIVVKQADVVTHSMGGVLANMYITSDAYRHDINRVITIGTPHSGSHIANYALYFLFNESKIPSDLSNNIITLCELTGRSLTNGAVEDLQVGSSANLQLIHDLKQPDAPGVPIYAISCDTNMDEPVGWMSFLYYLLGTLDTYCGGEYFGDNDMEEAIFGTKQTDFIVSCQSQRGGSAKSAKVYVTDHIDEAKDENVKEKVCELLNSPISNFGSNGFNPDLLSPPIGPVQLSEVGSFSADVAGTGGGMGTDDFISILSPQNHAVYRPGETVSIEAVCEEEVQSVLFIVPWGFHEGNSIPYTADFTIEEEFAGAFNAVAVALGNEGILSFDFVELAVEPSTSPQEIRVYPPSPLYLEAGTECGLYVQGIYPDEFVRDVTYLSTTNYSSGNPAVAAASESGVVYAISPGRTTIQIESGNASLELEVIVEGEGCYLGAYLGCGSDDLSCESISDFNQEMGKAHAIFVRYVDVADSENPSHFDWAQEVKNNGAMPMFIYDPWDGLGAINTTDVEHFASECNELDTTVFIVFGHEMNGPWYPWGNAPENYTSKFKEVAEIFHENAPNVEMCWVPNQNWGYPWGGTDYGDGYSEYYPEGIGTYGEYIDWVGLNFYEKDWDEDNLVPPDMFVANIRNEQDNADFYEMFAVVKNKPMLIAEMGAFDPNKDPTAPGERNPLNETEEAQFKNEWLEQAYNITILLEEFPKLNAICYFHVSKTETIDTQSHSFYDITANYRIPEIPSVYEDLISDPYFVGAEANSPPNLPGNPSPENHATGIPIDAELTWIGGDPDAGDSVTYDVYFDTTDATTLVASGQSSTTYSPSGILNCSTTYYWKVVAEDNHGATTSGPLWDFTTGDVCEVDISVVLQGGSRPPEAWEVPITIKFFGPGADVIFDSPICVFNLTTTKSDSIATCQCPDVMPNNYDITAVSEHTLINVKRNVVISAPSTAVDMGALLDGNANDDGIINISDFGILAISYLCMEGEPGYDARADFDRNGITNISDFGLLAVNYMQMSPIDIS
jgi:pimeloyl-ACP methyl ester carboxylesterase